MNDTVFEAPFNYKKIQIESEQIQFSMPSDLQTGCLLRTLVSSKPGGRFLELGTGTGLSLSWMIEAMDEHSTIVSVDNNKLYQRIAESYFGNDRRVSIVCDDGNKWLKKNKHERFDLIFADAMPGKYESTEEALALLPVGGLYVIDDMLPQPNWPAGHEKNVERLISDLEQRKNLRLTKLNWSTGIVIAAKIA